MEEHDGEDRAVRRRKSRRRSVPPSPLPSHPHPHLTPMMVAPYFWMWLGAMSVGRAAPWECALPSPQLAFPLPQGATATPIPFPSSPLLQVPLSGVQQHDHPLSHRKRRKLNSSSNTPQQHHDHHIAKSDSQYDTAPLDEEEEEDLMEQGTPVPTATSSSDPVTEEWVLDDQLAAMFARTEARRKARRERENMEAAAMIDPSEASSPPASVPLNPISTSVPLGVRSHAILALKGRLESAMRIHSQQAPMWPKEPLYCT
eukprot:TRINITY_DN3124_c0_g1_i1.p1 TRINITY_DN3124_c0_g1~~TRINITY_DN3124_c0_g1_i1.p1  ORF type:complete len:258 (-),score=29.00 TRINITY_DN3124_c0_g1_i1:1524-2297(-)